MLQYMPPFIALYRTAITASSSVGKPGSLTGLSSRTSNRKKFCLIAGSFCLLVWVGVQIPQSIVESYLFMDVLLALGSGMTLLVFVLLWIGGLVHEKQRTN